MINDGFFAKVVNHIWRDIPEEVEHCLRTYMWFINATTEEEVEGDFVRGICNYGNRISLKTVALDMHRSWSAIQKQVDLLVQYGYLSKDRLTDYGAYSYKVCDSYKFNKREERYRPVEEVTEVLEVISDEEYKKQAVKAAFLFSNKIMGGKPDPDVMEKRISEFLTWLNYPTNPDISLPIGTLLRRIQEAVDNGWAAEIKAATNPLDHFLRILDKVDTPKMQDDPAAEWVYEPSEAH